MSHHHPDSSPGHRPRVLSEDTSEPTDPQRADTGLDGVVAERSDPVTPGFGSMAAFAALPRVTGLALSVDGSRLIASVSTLDGKGSASVSSLWEIDPAGASPARRLTRGREGESAPVFTPDGSVLFTSTRVGPDQDDDAGKQQTLWRLPPGGEAKALLRRPGGFSAVVCAADNGTIAYATSVFGGAANLEEEAARRKARKDAGVSAILHDSYPIRLWDHDLGPAAPAVFVTPPLSVDLDQDEYAEGDPVPLDLAGLPNAELGGDLQISRDGRLLAFTRSVTEDGPYAQHREVVVHDLASGESRSVLSAPAVDGSGPVFSPDGASQALVRTTFNTLDDPGHDVLCVVDLGDGALRELAADLDRPPSEYVWTADGTAILFTADDDGHRPVYRVDVGRGEVRRLTATGAYASLQVAPDGSALYALRDHIDTPPQPVRLDPHAPDQDPPRLPAPGAVDGPGRVERLQATAEDGVDVPAWLVLPHGASADAPVTMLLWIHGGPHGSWNAWSWRWNPWLMAAKGYAVLLPDPGLSTGYGHDILARGYGAWGSEPFTDLMAVTTAAEGRPDIDAARTAAMGGSFGGYMANWVATRTDRFTAIVTHASLWDLDHFAGSTDFTPYWARQFGDPLVDPQRYVANSPHLGVTDIRTPMLVIHGDRDYRVPIGQGLRLWADLQRAGVPSRFLYYPDENHWILTPGNHGVWYETVWAFLDQHVHGHDFRRPDLV